MEDNKIEIIAATVAETNNQVMKLNVTVNSLIARLEAFEKMYTSGNVASKRPIKLHTSENDEVASMSSTSSKHKTTVDGAGSEEKIINALTFFKKIVMYKNYDNLRTKYSTEDMINTAKLNVKKPEGTESYWISIGNAIWKILDKDQKKSIREEFNKWKIEHQIIGDISQLNEDEQDSS